MKFGQHGMEVGINKNNGLFGWIPKGLEWRCKNRPKSTILRDFWGIFGIFMRGKGTQDHQCGRIILINV
jgi:hypothetical protein